MTPVLGLIVGTGLMIASYWHGGNNTELEKAACAILLWEAVWLEILIIINSRSR